MIVIDKEKIVEIPADLLRRLGRGPEAATAYRRALALATNPVEQAFLTRRLGEVVRHG
jgi:RNA polymerase sigma-70 factor (ECF subfamily)